MRERFRMYALEFVKGKRRGVYVGIAVDPDKRLAEHAAGRGAKSLRGAVIVRTIWRSDSVHTRAEAQALEYRLKRLPAASKLCADTFANFATGK